MEMTKEQVKYVMDQNWDEDIRQDALVRVLDFDGEVKHFKTWISMIYNNCLQTSRTRVVRRQELVAERTEELEGLHSHNDIHDPLFLIEADDLIYRVMKLSPLLYNTLRDYTLGTTPEEMANEQGIHVNVIYQRIWQAKKEIANE